MGDWQTMETAPKDGTQVLGYGRYRNIDPERYAPAMGLMAWVEIAGCWAVNASPFKPTRWMPLPAPPGGVGESEPTLLSALKALFATPWRDRSKQ